MKEAVEPTPVFTDIAIRAYPKRHNSKVDADDFVPCKTGVNSGGHKTLNLNVEAVAAATAVTPVSAWHDANITRWNKVLLVKTQANAYCSVSSNYDINQQMARGDRVDPFAENFSGFEVPGHTLAARPYY